MATLVSSDRSTTWPASATMRIVGAYTRRSPSLRVR
jgi:hypothetical protein